MRLACPPIVQCQGGGGRVDSLPPAKICTCLYISRVGVEPFALVEPVFPPCVCLSPVGGLQNCLEQRPFFTRRLPPVAFAGRVDALLSLKSNNTKSTHMHVAHTLRHWP